MLASLTRQAWQDSFKTWEALVLVDGLKLARNWGVETPDLVAK